ncbi:MULTISPECIES: hypothetical protein [Bacillus]|uniref:hypothetical protein n=1 Tax=Bacillus TaxID=1386 RepID=UPI00032DD2D6|nr:MULTISPECIES: hypothetical protein [Bacillus cereus group]EOP55719.1 hypothetical protein IIW_00637 [Bacillus cereus VD136]EOP74464.1 hypothetical protein KOW_02944 [Bacillus cereus VDM006]EOQ12307.1 hypothetical protein KOY_00582 [Bacillus cereus VDM021]OOG91519.1 hypothetical protein BTH41_01455 [Bacillus mycoides]MDF2084795.1 hypothetical protein [Bacillus pseudomycoides]
MKIFMICLGLIGACCLGVVKHRRSGTTDDIPLLVIGMILMMVFLVYVGMTD